MSESSIRIAREAAYFLRREMDRAGVLGVLTPRLVNPQAQGWVYGFARGLGDALDTTKDDASARYTLEITLYITLFEGTPMGEQLGVEALMMAQRMESMPGATGMLTTWRAALTDGRAAGAAFAVFQQSIVSFGAAFTTAS
jgi:hypothetical protein